MHPTFLVIGAQKSGTTWLQKNLGEHPDICTPKYKEIHFFDKAHIYKKGPKWYQTQFEKTISCRASGEYTPNYLWEPKDPAEALESGHFPGIANRVYELNPNIRWIAILRDPVERAISAYYHQIRAGRVAPTQRISEVWGRFGIRSMGDYATALKQWFKLFPEAQGKILIFEEDILKTPEKSLIELYQFLGVDPDFRPASVARRRNIRNSDFLLHLNYRAPFFGRIFQKICPRLGGNLTRFRILVEDEERDQLTGYYTNSILELENLLDRSLPWGR